MLQKFKYLLIVCVFLMPLNSEFGWRSFGWKSKTAGALAVLSILNFVYRRYVNPDSQASKMSALITNPLRLMRWIKREPITVDSLGLTVDEIKTADIETLKDIKLNGIKPVGPFARWRSTKIPKNVEDEIDKRIWDNFIQQLEQENFYASKNNDEMQKTVDFLKTISDTTQFISNEFWKKLPVKFFHSINPVLMAYLLDKFIKFFVDSNTKSIVIEDILNNPKVWEIYEASKSDIVKGVLLSMLIDTQRILDLTSNRKNIDSELREKITQNIKDNMTISAKNYVLDLNKSNLYSPTM